MQRIYLKLLQKLFYSHKNNCNRKTLQICNYLRDLIYSVDKKLKNKTY